MSKTDPKVRTSKNEDLKAENFDQVNQANQSLKKRIDKNHIHSLVKDRNLDSIRFHSAGPNSNVFVAKHSKNGKKILMKVIPKSELAKLGASILIRSFPSDFKTKTDKLETIYTIINTEHFLIVLSDRYQESLAKLLSANRGPFDESLIRELFRLILQALSYLHSNKLAHRNLKLDNILFRDSCSPVITDFHYTVILDDDAEHRRQLLNNSLPYLAPEILAGIPYDPILADIWAFGVCLFACLTYRFPFPAKIDLNLLHQNLPLNFGIGSNLTDSVRSILKSMLEFNPDKRIDTQSLLKNAWFTSGSDSKPR